MYCYVVFPLSMIVRVRGKRNNAVLFTAQEELPEVAVIMAVYNEEEVIAEKLRTTFATSYPREKLHVYIGSDNSTDATHAIIETFRKEYAQLSLKMYSQRQGKPAIINDLVAQCTEMVIILTDANVYFEPETVFELIKHYKNPEIGLVGALIVNTNVKKSGISYQEKTYLSLENKVKFAEGVLGGAMIGAFGGAFSLRRELYKPVPPNFIVDDFYITMQVLVQGRQAILEPTALCYEDVANVPSEEFRRKVRISTGNFQNLREFRSLLRCNSVGLYFFSHKVLRWLTPFFLCGIILISGILAFYSFSFAVIFAVFACSLIAVAAEGLLKKIGIHTRLLRFISHFYRMNFALLIGYCNYKKGVQSNVWQPTKRNQN
ncbi:MAG: glycosyltransferase [Bacteroidales bacterium]|nr:glycosyltransferase [Bacteroidales bacterium]